MLNAKGQVFVLVEEISVLLVGGLNATQGKK
jgi:hypothetical protein